MFDDQNTNNRSKVKCGIAPQGMPQSLGVIVILAEFSYNPGQSFIQKILPEILEKELWLRVCAFVVTR